MVNNETMNATNNKNENFKTVSKETFGETVHLKPVYYFAFIHVT